MKSSQSTLIRSLTSISLVFLAVAFCCTPLDAKSTAKSKTSGSGAENSWQPFTSKLAAFTVSLPGPVSVTQTESTSHKKWTFNSRNAAGTEEFFVIATKYEPGLLSRKTRTRLMSETAMLHINMSLGEVTSHHFGEFDGHDSLNFEFKGHSRQATHTSADHIPDLYGKGHVIWTGNTEYCLVVQSSEDGFKSDADRFFESFRTKI